MAAIGRSGVRIDPNKLELAFEGIPIVKEGTSLGPLAERRIAQIVRRKEFTVVAHLGQGQATARLWTTDLSDDYVRINATYRS